MGKPSLLFLLFYGLPESIILICLSAALYGYDVRNNLKRILPFSILSVITIYLVRSLEVKFPMNIGIQIPVFTLLAMLFLKVSFRRALVIILTSFMISLLGENAYYTALMSFFGERFSTLMNEPFSKFVYLLILFTLTFIVIKRKISFANALHFFRTATLNTKLTLLITMVLAQALLAGFLQMASIFDQFSIYPVAFNSHMLRLMIGVALITIPVVSIFMLKRLFTLSQQEAISATQEAFMDNINNLFITVRGQRHDFLNHVQVLYSMLKSRQVEDAVTYMDNLLEEIQEVNEVIKVKHPALSALLNTKLAVAERHKIHLDTDIETSIEDLNMKSLDLVKILGNLLDNAIEAVAGQPSEFRKVKVSIKKYDNIYIFEIHNSRPVIPAEEIDKIFSGGYSSKGNDHSGLGLAVIKEILHKYKGDIGVKSSEKEGTAFTVIIPR